MKLYTEEQVMNALKLAHSHIKPLQYVIDTLTPIELPSDEEILDEAYAQRAMVFSFTDGAKWMRYKIGGSNEQ